MLDRFIYLCFPRCIYLDLVPDCSSAKRFFAARGVPTLIVSDNNSQFISNETQSFVKSRVIE